MEDAESPCSSASSQDLRRVTLAMETSNAASPASFPAVAEARTETLTTGGSRIVDDVAATLPNPVEVVPSATASNIALQDGRGEEVEASEAPSSPGTQSTILVRSASDAQPVVPIANAKAKFKNAKKQRSFGSTAGSRRVKREPSPEAEELQLPPPIVLDKGDQMDRYAFQHEAAEMAGAEGPTGEEKRQERGCELISHPSTGADARRVHHGKEEPKLKGEEGEEERKAEVREFSTLSEAGGASCSTASSFRNVCGQSGHITDDGGAGEEGSIAKVERNSSMPSRSPSLSSSTSSRLLTGGASRDTEEEEKAWELAAIHAQELQLRHTLLSTFPPAFSQEGSEGSTSAASAVIPPFALAQEPLVPLLNALCEDKTYVHAAWCRYQDDIAVRRTQNSIQRKRQRHSFNKGMRKSSGSTVRQRGSKDDGSGVDADDSGESDDEAELLQPPASQWVEAPPAFTGGPRPFISRQSTAPAAASGGGDRAGDSGSSCGLAARVASGGFQWTPWRFYRTKGRKTARSNAAAGPSLASLHATLVTEGAIEVPSLPILQVEVDLPESAHAVVPPMTPEERKAYARYVMSSGKLRHDCRDSYAFLVSRAKEMRMQWERQHPFQ